MIVSHKHRFIYLKTIKTASSSMEIALSRLLGPEDIITPAREDLGDQRAQAFGGQNYRLEHPDVPRRPLWRRLLGRPERYYHPSVGFYEHMPAWRVRRYVGEEVWNSYYKFAFERNPWDRQVSFYYYKTRHKNRPPSFEAFLRRKDKAWVWNYDIYAIDGEIAVDFVGAYENVMDDFEKAMKDIGIKEKTELPMANAARREKDDYRQHFTPETRDLVAGWYAREIEAFGYEF